MKTQEKTPEQQKPKDQDEEVTQTDTESEANDEPKTGLNEEEDAGNQAAGSVSVTE